MGPVRIGNLAYRRVQNDVYGSVMLAATHSFFDQPDAGLWKLRGSARVHAFRP